MTLFAILLIAAAFLWGFATASATTGVANAKKIMITNFLIGAAAGFIVSGFGLGAAIFVGGIAVFGSYTAARLPDTNRVKKYFNLMRR